MKSATKKGVGYVKKCVFCPVENLYSNSDIHKFSPLLSHRVWISLWTFPQNCGKNRDFQDFFGVLVG